MYYEGVVKWRRMLIGAAVILCGVFLVSRGE